MAIAVAGQEINRVLILDDEPEARRSMRFALEEAGVEPVVEDGPIRSRGVFLRSVGSRADAVLSDYRLTPGNYATEQGDSFVASCIQARIPALLCTTYADTDIMINRRLMRFIPVVLRTRSPEPEQIVDGYQRCLLELSGELRPSRRPWRTLVRVHDVDGMRQYCHVVVPGWNVEQKIRVSFESIPAALRRSLKPDKRLHAKVNTGAEDSKDLFFDEWEAD